MFDYTDTGKENIAFMGRFGMDFVLPCLKLHRVVCVLVTQSIIEGFLHLQAEYQLAVCLIPLEIAGSPIPLSLSRIQRVHYSLSK